MYQIHIFEGLFSGFTLLPSEYELVSNQENRIILFQTGKGLILGSCCRDTGRARGDDPDVSRVHSASELDQLALVPDAGAQESTALAADGAVLPAHLTSPRTSILSFMVSELFTLFFTWPLNIYVFYGSDLGHSPEFKLWER